MKDCLLVYSGGLDSTTMLYEFRDRIALAVSFHYGSKHNDRELEFAAWHCEAVRTLARQSVSAALDYV